MSLELELQTVTVLESYAGKSDHRWSASLQVVKISFRKDEKKKKKELCDKNSNTTLMYFKNCGFLQYSWWRSQSDLTQSQTTLLLTDLQHAMQKTPFYKRVSTTRSWHWYQQQLRASPVPLGSPHSGRQRSLEPSQNLQTGLLLLFVFHKVLVPKKIKTTSFFLNRSHWCNIITFLKH